LKSPVSCALSLAAEIANKTRKKDEVSFMNRLKMHGDLAEQACDPVAHKNPPVDK